MLKFRIVDCIEDFENLRNNWDDVFKNDKEATVFQSWSWLRGWIDVIPNNWLVITIQRDAESESIAFIALYKNSTSAMYGMSTHHTLQMAGEPLIDYTGLLCLPQYRDKVIEYLGNSLQKDIRWNQFRLREVSDPRITEIVRQLDKKNYVVQYKKETACPQLHLPDSWEDYLEKTLDTKFSKKFKSKIAKAERKGCYTSTANDEDLELYLQHYIKLHEMRWGKLDERMRKLFLSTFKWSYYANMLRIDALWYEGNLTAIQVSFCDRRKNIFHFYNGGWDPDYASLSPGIVLHGHCIKYAIENGYMVYDFMRGDESYKYLFGAVNEYNKNIVISANTISTKLRKVKNRVIGNAATG